jgi:hypothetical protein
VFDALMVKQQQTFVASEATSPDREAEESKWTDTIYKTEYTTNSLKYLDDTAQNLSWIWHEKERVIRR